MNPTVESIILQLSEKMGVATEVIWASYIKQAYIYNGLNIILIPCLIYIIVPMYKFIKLKTTETENTFAEWDDEGKFFSYLALFIYLIVCIFLAVHWTSCVSGIINPEWWAFQEILSGLKK